MSSWSEIRKQYTGASICDPYKTQCNTSVIESIVNDIKEAYPNTTPEQEEKLREVLSPVFKNPDSQYNGIEKSVDLMLGKFDLKLDASLTKQAKLNQKKSTEKTKQQVKNNRVEQNAEVSMKLPEPAVSDSKYASVVDNEDCDNSLAQDYPNSYGSVSEAGDYYKINKNAKTVEMVHSSGTRIKIDQAGNVTIAVAGTLKLVAESDVAIESGGGLDIVASKGIYLHSDNVDIVADSALTMESQETKIDSQTLETSAMQFKAESAQVTLGTTCKVNGMVSAAGYGTG